MKAFIVLLSLMGLLSQPVLAQCNCPVAPSCPTGGAAVIPLSGWSITGGASPVYSLNQPCNTGTCPTGMAVPVCPNSCPTGLAAPVAPIIPFAPAATTCPVAPPVCPNTPQPCCPNNNIQQQY